MNSKSSHFANLTLMLQAFLKNNLFLNMALLKEISFLLRKEFILEWRQKYALSGILLYVLSTVYIVYAATQQVQPNIWNALFWIIILFASVNAIAKSFTQDGEKRQLYFYTLVNPMAVIISKIIYNALLLGLIALLSFGAFSLVAGNPVKEGSQFGLALFLGSLGFSIAFTFISAIASQAKNSSTLMAIMSFPVIIPVLLTLIKLSANSMRIMQDTAIWKDIYTLIAIDGILIAVSVVLFPFLWRD